MNLWETLKKELPGRKEILKNPAQHAEQIRSFLRAQDASLGPLLILAWDMTLPRQMLKLKPHRCDEAWLKERADDLAAEHLVDPELTLAALRQWAYALEVMDPPIAGTALPQSTLKAFTETISGIDMLPIPRGQFWMGAPKCDPQIFRFINPQFAVTFSQNFWLARTPVTQQQWAAVMDSQPASCRSPEAPVESITWQQARDFCSRLTELARRAGSLPPGRVFRLPSEAEWEYACRAGRPSRDSQVADFSLVAWHGQIANQPMPVGQKQPNPWGLFDLLGNVYEWCEYAFVPYPETAQVDYCVVAVPQDDAPTTMKVARGGCYDSADLINCLPFTRMGGEPEVADSLCGFRIACGEAFPDEEFYLNHNKMQEGN